jgi:hypothetical protein
LTRGQAPLRALRAIMEEVYRLLDRRCGAATALAKLARLRQQVPRFRSLGKCLDKLPSPNLKKALTFLDAKLLPATSNAVEWAIGGCGRCRRRSTACGSERRSGVGSRWTGSANGKRLAGTRP